MKHHPILLLAPLLLFFQIGWAASEFRSTEYIVENVFITGHESYTTRQLKRQLNLKSRTFWRSTTFTRRLLELDRLGLESFYVNNGYLYCVVTDSFSIKPRNRVDVYFFIKEGPQYLLSSIHIVGAQSISEELVRAAINHKLYQPYNPQLVREGIKKIQRELANKGKPLATVRDSLVVQRGIDLYLIIQENPTLYVNQIQIVNNNKVKERPIRREIVLKPGQRFSQDKLELSERRLYETGLFSSVRIRPNRIDTLSKQLDLLVDVREMEMRYLGMNFGFGQNRGITIGSEPYTSFSISGEWLHRNLGGVGRRLSLKLATSMNLSELLLVPQTSGELSYVEPWLLGFRSSTTCKLYIQNQILEEQSQTNYGIAVSMLYQPDRRTYIEAGAEVKDIRFSTKIAAELVNPLDRERAININLRHDRRDDFLFPKKGTLFTTNGKIVGAILGGTQDYFKFETTFSQYFTFFRTFTIAYRAKLGWLESFRVGDPTPAYEKFYLGGSNSLRGWPERKFKTDAADYAVGDNIKALTSLELRFPLFWLLGIELFVDGGNLSPNFAVLQKSHYRWNWGLGLTIATPLGPVRIDYAWKINPTKDEKENPSQIQFGIPYAF